MPEVDELSLGLQSNIGAGTKDVDLLIASLGRLTTSLSNVSSKGLNRFSENVEKIGSSIKNIDETKAENISVSLNALANGIEQISGVHFNNSGFNALYTSISRLGNAKVGNATNNLGTLKNDFAQFVNGINSVGTVSFDATGLANVLQSIAKLGGKASTQAVQNLPPISAQLQNFVRQLNQIGSVTFDATGLANVVNSISRIGSKTGTQAAANLSPISAQLLNLVRQLNNIGTLNFDTTNLSNLVYAISKLGGKNVSSAVVNIPQLATALSELMNVMSKAPSINQNIIDMTNALANLASRGRSVGSAGSTLQNSFNGISRGADRARKSTRSLAAAFGKFYATFWLVIRAARMLGKAIDLSSQLTEVQNVVDVSFAQYKSVIEDFSKTSIVDYGMTELTAKTIASRYQAMGTAMGFTRGEMADMSVELTKLAADMASFYNLEQNVVAEDLESVFTGMTRPLRKYGMDLTEATLKEWAMQNGLEANFKTMTQAEKTMLRYQYVMAQTANAQGDFARTSDTWANQTRILKQNFQQLGIVIGQDLINSLKPLVSGLNVVILKFIQFAQVVSDALGKIFGWKYEITNVGVTEDIEDGLGGIEDGATGAGKAVEKLNKGLRAFDELNIITLPNDKGSGSGGSDLLGGGLGNTDELGKWVETEKLYDSFIDDLYGLGEYIGKSIYEELAGIEWKKIYSGAESFGTGLAQFLNGLISPQLFGSVGTTIANSLNTALHAANAFAIEFDFYELGQSIGQGINDFLLNFDWHLAAETMNNFVDGLKDAIRGFFEANWDAKDILDGIIDFAVTLDLDTVSVLIGSFLWFHGGKQIVKNGLKKLLAKEIEVGIGDKNISIGTTIGISIVTAIIGFKVGQWLYDHVPTLQEWSDSIGEWIFGKDFEEIKIDRAITVALSGLTVSFGAAGIYGLIRSALKKKTEEALAEEVAVSAPKGSILLKIAAVAITAEIAFEVGKWLGEQLFPEDAEIYKEFTIFGKGGFVDEVFLSGYDDLGDWADIQMKAFQLWFDDIVNYSHTRIGEMKNFFNSDIAGVPYEFGEKLKTDIFAWGNEVFGWIIEKVNGTVQNAESAIDRLINKITGIPLDKLENTMNSLMSSAQNKLKTNTPHSIPTNIPGFASGGYVPSKFSMFTAGENGIPEMIGTVGGKTAVAGGQEITGIRDEVRNQGEVEASLLNTVVELLRVISQKEFGITQDAVGRAARNYAREFSNRTGSPAYNF